MTPTAARAGLLQCHDCDLLNRPPADGDEGACARCGATLHSRQPNSIARAAALTVFSMVMRTSCFAAVQGREPVVSIALNDTPPL